MINGLPDAMLKVNNWLQGRKLAELGFEKLKEDKVMKNTDELVKALKEEYVELVVKMAKLNLAAFTLPLNDRERELLNEQLEYMDNYSETLLERAKYAVEKERAE